MAGPGNGHAGRDRRYVYRVDPYFLSQAGYGRYFYTLDNQRSQNDGICKHFDYDALVTGTSMTENFKISEVNALFGVNAIKVPYSGGTYKEINDSLVIAFQNNPNLKTVIRCLDYSKLLEEKDAMRNDLGKYPTYLYDSDPFNDVFYLFNKDVLFSRSYAMTLAAKEPGFQPGITSFDAIPAGRTTTPSVRRRFAERPGYLPGRIGAL